MLRVNAVPAPILRMESIQSPFGWGHARRDSRPRVDRSVVTPDVISSLPRAIGSVRADGSVTTNVQPHRSVRRRRRRAAGGCGRRWSRSPQPRPFRSIAPSRTSPGDAPCPGAGAYDLGSTCPTGRCRWGRRSWRRNVTSPGPNRATRGHPAASLPVTTRRAGSRRTLCFGPLDDRRISSIAGPSHRLPSRGSVAPRPSWPRRRGDATPVRDAAASGGLDARWLCFIGRRTTSRTPARAPATRTAVRQPRV